MQTVCLLNPKGGVGQTSTCYHLAGALAGLGLRVVLVDNDPQASLIKGFFGPEGMESFPPETTVAAAYDLDESPIASTLIRPTGFRGVEIIPGSPALTAYNMTPPEAWGPSIAGLRDLLADLDADVALIGCPPNLHLCSVASLTAAAALVVPLQAEDFGSQGLGPVRQAVACVREALNPDLQLAGYLLTMYDKRLGIHLACEAKLREMFGADVFASTFPLAKDFKESVASRQPIGFYKPKSAAAKSARAVPEEMLERLGQGGEVAEGRAA